MSSRAKLGQRVGRQQRRVGFYVIFQNYIPIFTTRYRKRIHGRLCDIQRTFRLHSPAKRAVAKEFMKLVASFVHGIVSRYAEDDDEIFAKMVRDEVYAKDLGRLQSEYRAHEETRIEKVLDEIVIDDESSVLAIIGQPRIELVSYLAHLCNISLVDYD